MDEIVFMSEKRNVDNSYKVVWPGDEYFEMANNNNNPTINNGKYIAKETLFKYSNKPVNYIREEENAQYKRTEDKRLNSMKNRYFSIENVELIKEREDKDNETSVITNELTTVEIDTTKFVERRDYLLKKLFQSRTLPDPNKNSETSIDVNDTEKEQEKEITTSANIESNESEACTSKLFKPNRRHSFQDEFIPLFDTKKKEEKESVTAEIQEILNYNPSLSTLENYRGSYSIGCIKRVRQYLIDSFAPHSTNISRSNQTDRLFEIVKMKLNIKSKFDSDKRLWRMIKRDTESEKQSIDDRLNAQERRIKLLNNSKKNNKNHIRFFENDNETTSKTTSKRKATAASYMHDSDDDIILSEDQDEPTTKQNTKKRKTETSDNEDDVIKMINEMPNEDEILFVELTDDEEEEKIKILNNENDDEDSKCKQFGKYSKNISKTKIQKKIETSSNLRQSKQRKRQLQQQQHSIDAAKNLEENSFNRTRLANENSINNKINNIVNSNNFGDELENLELKYKTLRNKRNKMLRKKKGVEIEAQRELMSSELKSIRTRMKKLRRKNNKQQKQFDKKNTSFYSDLAYVQKKPLKKFNNHYFDKQQQQKKQQKKNKKSRVEKKQTNKNNRTNQLVSI